MTRPLVVLAAAVVALVSTGGAQGGQPTFFTSHIDRDLSPLPAAPAGPCAFAVGRHVSFDIREIFFTDAGGNVVRQAVLTPDATETFTNLSNGDTVTIRTPSAQHYVYNPDGSIEIATTGLGFVVNGGNGIHAVDAGRHVILLVPVYDDSGNLVTYDVGSVSDAGPQDTLFPTLCRALA